MVQSESSFPRRGSVAEAQKSKGKEGDAGKGRSDHNRSTIQHPKEELSQHSLKSASKIRSVHERTTANSGASPSPQTPKPLTATTSPSLSTSGDRVIMAATVEKLVQKLTSEI
ncbi:hypothetical protein BGZ65_010551, partial [Modicella reniformis]